MLIVYIFNLLFVACIQSKLDKSKHKVCEDVFNEISTDNTVYYMKKTDLVYFNDLCQNLENNLNYQKDGLSSLKNGLRKQIFWFSCALPCILFVLFFTIMMFKIFFISIK